VLVAVAYVRVSTEEQRPENQKEYLTKWAREKGIKIAKFYIDKGVSGASPPWERPAFRRLIEEVQSGAVEPRPSILLVYEISRLVRSFQELFALLDLVEGKLNLTVVSASEREHVLQSLDGPYRQFLRAVLAFVATMERELIRQRTKVAMERARREGKISSGMEKMGEEEKKRAVEMWRSGASLGEIASALGVSQFTVRKLLASAERRVGVCPRCLHKMYVVDRRAVEHRGKMKIVVRYYCRNCGYEETVEERGG
jgi:DNA invertase Pin-like site-specific DNA recombinase